MRRCPNPERRLPTSAGFTLVEIAVVIVVLSLLLAMIAGIATAMIGQQRREATRQRLAGIETALALFVSQNKRLPCPADGVNDGTAVNAGLEDRNPAGSCRVGFLRTGAASTNLQTNGVVPWRTLGLSELEATDGWGNRLTYRVAPELVLANALDLTACDPGGTTGGLPGGFCNTTCSTGTFPLSCTPPTAYTAGKGLKVRSLSAVVTLTMSPNLSPSTGAAYIVISHGENGAGAFSNQGLLQAGTIAAGTLEGNNNGANVGFAHATSTALTDASAFVDDFPSYIDGTGHFDDVVLRPTILTVATKAQLGPRAH